MSVSEPSPEIAITGSQKSWWSDEDDLFLLIQVNNDRPFLAVKNKMKAWQATASATMMIEGFSRRSLDGKKASQRFQLLVEAHRQHQAKAKFMSGCSEDETEKSQLLDELVALVDDQRAVKIEQQKTEVSGKEEKRSATAMIRDEAMQRGSKRRSVDGGEDGSGTSKKKALVDLQNAEIQLEQQKLEYKRMKLEAELQEQALARKERAEMREMDMKRHADMMELIKFSLSKQ